MKPMKPEFRSQNSEARIQKGKPVMIGAHKPKPMAARQARNGLTAARKAVHVAFDQWRQRNMYPGD